MLNTLPKAQQQFAIFLVWVFVQDGVMHEYGICLVVGPVFYM